MIGRKLSHYEILDEISRGGMGVVYRAMDVRLNREVALKVLPEELVADPDRRRRFVQEAQAASALEHPHIAVIHEIDEADGITFIAMELIRGEKLADLVARRRLPPGRALELATEIAEALARAHDKNIVHRDLKPGNVMLTEDVHVKIIDFGLAKLIERDAPALGTAVTQAHEGTDAGVVLGTVSYMSPEQAAGDRVDHRTDIFSFGVLLFEMLTGDRPFEGRTGVDTLHAIINTPAPALPELGAGVLPEASHEVARIVDKCLAKDPANRYQGMRDVVVDLRGARRQLESGSVASMARGSAAPARAGAPASRRTTRVAAVVAAASIVVAIALVMFRGRSVEPQRVGGSKPSVAVLYFENNTGNPSLDWLRTGLTDMVVTDLSQLPDVEVLSTDRLHRILDSLKRADDRVISADVVDAVAREAGVDTVLLGSFVKAGDTIRINVKLQDARTGRIVTSERGEGVGEASIFSIVDDLTRRIRTRLVPQTAAGAGRTLLEPVAPRPSGGAELDRGLKDVTTASIEAYRYYSEGIHLHERLKEKEAIPLLQKAVELDPGFAMALAKLAVIAGNLDRPRESADYAKRALEHADRLTPRERLYIEGVHHSRRPESVPQAIEAYRKAIELYPDHASARHNLALIAYDLENDDEVIAQIEALRKLGGSFPSSFAILAGAYAHKGDFERGHEAHLEFLRRFPENAMGHCHLGHFLVGWGRLDEGIRALDKAKALGAPEFLLFLGYYTPAVLRENWTEADELSRKLSAVTEPFPKLVGFYSRAQLALYRGRSGEALAHLEQALRNARPPFTAVLQTAIGELRLARGEMPLARAAAEKGRLEGKGSPAEMDGLRLSAIVHARMDEAAAAEQMVDALRTFAKQIPAPSAARMVNSTVGTVALARGNPKEAVDALTKAQATLKPRPQPGPPTDHVRIWFELAEAHLAAGDRIAASKWFQQIVDSQVERVYYPVQFVRSYYFLGQIAEQNGDREKARDNYQRFVGYWKDADFDRGRVAEAMGKISSTPSLSR
jgi:eukaryotic-like serine/threonine-protein kinase